METSARITRSFHKEDVTRDWWVVDAAGKTVGRLATEVATLLRGKHKTIFTPHVDTGDFVVVINAAKVVMQGKRTEMKEYFHSTLYPGGGRFESFRDLKVTNPEKIIMLALRGMLPKNRLGRQIIKKLKVYGGGEHPHAAQMPIPYELKF